MGLVQKEGRFRCKDPFGQSFLWVQHLKGPLVPPLSLVLTGLVPRPGLAWRSQFPQEALGGPHQSREGPPGGQPHHQGRAASTGPGLAQAPTLCPPERSPVQPNA